MAEWIYNQEYGRAEDAPEDAWYLERPGADLDECMLLIMRHEKGYAIFNDAAGMGTAEYVAGPWPTLDEAKVRYIVMVNTMEGAWV